MNRSNIFLWSLALFTATTGAAACSPVGPRVTPNGSASSAPPAPPAPVRVSAAPTTPTAPLLNAAFEAMIDEAFALSDPLRTASRQTAPLAKTRQAIATQGTFPERKRVAKALAFTFGRSEVEGCTDTIEQPIAKSGAFCPDVVVPGVALTDAEIDGVHGLVVAAEKAAAGKAKRARVRCGFDAHHAIVLYDKAGTAIAKYVVCFTCSEWAVMPGGQGVGDGSPAVMEPNEAATLKGLFDKHGLSTWPFDETLGQTVKTYEREVYGTPDAPTAAGLERVQKRGKR